MMCQCGANNVGTLVAQVKQWKCVVEAVQHTVKAGKWHDSSCRIWVLISMGPVPSWINS